jgi:TATA-binding protein-associated factor Taf7
MNPKPKGKNRKQSQTNYQNPYTQTKYMRKHTKGTISPNPKTFAHLRKDKGDEPDAMGLWLSSGPGGAAASRAADEEDVPTRICDGAIWGED